MSAAAEELRFGFTMDDLHRLTRVSLSRAHSTILDSDDRWEAAYFAICETLYSESEQPTEWALITAGAMAVDRETRAWLRQHGQRLDSRNNGSAFQKFWINQPRHFPDDWICEALALPAVWNQLSEVDRESLLAASTATSRRDAADALGISYVTLNNRVSRARNRFIALWYDHEQPPPKKTVASGCSIGHDPGEWRDGVGGYCRKCRRLYRLRRRAKGKAW